MSTKSLAKTSDEIYLDLYEKYRTEHGGPVRMEDVAQWIEDEKLLPQPKVSPVSIHAKKLKQAARRKRIVDPRGRKVRKIIAAKIERLISDGQTMFDVVWDLLYEMSADHALIAFQQRDDNITNQRLAATRDVESCLEFNPNLSHCKDQFVFAFMLEETSPMTVAKISESPSLPISSPSQLESEIATRRERDNTQPR